MEIIIFIVSNIFFKLYSFVLSIGDIFLMSRSGVKYLFKNVTQYENSIKGQTADNV